MNIFYASPLQIKNKVIELTGQEAKHAAKVLRYSVGDDITVVDGVGNWYEGQIQLITPKTVRIVADAVQNKRTRPKSILGMSIIKKRNRLEFAVEKAVELGVKEIALFRGEHSVKQNLRRDRIESTVLSAMKQSLQAWLPDISIYKNLEEVLAAYPDCNKIAAHQTMQDIPQPGMVQPQQDTLLLVGPEGGFSEQEIESMNTENVQLISLGENRLRAETAAITLLGFYKYLLLAD